MGKQTKVVSFRLHADDIKQLERFKRSLVPSHGAVTNAVALRIALRKLNAEQEQK